jgi:multisubunit Na+/H+ antiporter MnhB subunit
MAISIGGLIQLLIILLALGIIVWLAYYILANFQPPEPLGRIIRVAIMVVAVLIVVVLMLNFAGVGTPIHITN